jgi:hypothetical protein
MEKAEEAMEQWKLDGISLKLTYKRDKHLKLHKNKALYLQKNIVFVNRFSSQFKRLQAVVSTNCHKILLNQNSLNPFI